MPNRILKESICFSPEIEQLSWFEEVVFYRLLTIVDDLGHMDGRDIVLMHSLFPTREDVSKQQVGDAINKLVEVGLISRYTADSRPYIAIVTWHEHQKLRRYRQKYPFPPNYTLPVAAEKVTFLDSKAPTANGKTPSMNGKMPSTGGHQTAEVEVEEETEYELDYRYDNEDDRKHADAPSPPYDDNPYSEEHGPTPSFDTIQAYASNSLRALNAGNLEAINSYVNEMGEELVRYAIDTACANGVPYWRYTEGILVRLKEQGITTVANAKAADEKFRHSKDKPDDDNGGNDKWVW